SRYSKALVESPHLTSGSKRSYVTRDKRPAHSQFARRPRAAVQCDGATYDRRSVLVRTNCIGNLRTNSDGSSAKRVLTSPTATGDYSCEIASERVVGLLRELFLTHLLPLPSHR